VRMQLDDLKIDLLLTMPKTLPEDYRERLLARPKRGHSERELDISSADGTEFRIIIRQSMFNALDFSVILAFRPPKTSQLIRLKRYNGKSHEHENRIEGNNFYGFHIHTATERYQEMGLREDAYAELTDRYADLDSAVRCMLQDCGFEAPRNSQPGLFDKEF
jgi:hypothetical protein